MAFFSFKKNDQTKQENTNQQTTPKMCDLSDIHQEIDARIEASMKEMMDPNLVAAMQMTDDTGGYFGNEFELRLTAGRMKSLYTREPWIFSASTLIARTLSSVPMLVYDKATGVRLKNHPIEQLLKVGCPIEDGMSATWAGDLDLDLTGNCFFVLNETFRSYMQVPAEMVTIKLADPQRDGRIGLQKIVISMPDKESGIKKEYDYRYVVHIKLPNPTYKFYGMPVWLAASRATLLDRFKNEYEMAFYLRGATHTGVIESTEEMTTSRLSRLMRTFEAAFTGRRNWWRPLFLPKGAKWVASSPTMAEMQHLEGMRENRKTILAVRGVPPSAVGLVEDVNRATAEQQTKVLYENTIVPMALFWAAGWNNSYLIRTVYRGLVEIRPDFSGIEALQGSLISRGEQAKAVEGHWKLDEIRTKIYNLPPMGDERGDKLVAEIRAAATPQQPASLPTSMLSVMQPETEATQEADQTDETVVEKSVNPTIKAEATSSQNRIEEKLASSMAKAYRAFIDEALATAIKSIRSQHDVKKTLNVTSNKRIADYWNDAEPSMVKALDRGFGSAQANVRCLGSKYIKYEFTQDDRQAIEILQERTSEGQRRLLAERSLTRFAGHSERVTEQIMSVIEAGHERGDSWDKIAHDLRDNYDETYPNQMNTIVRTETLSAVSQGMKWNQDALKTVFTKVQKQWLHQGDADSNPNAREWHADYDSEGVVEVDHVYQGTDNSGTPSQLRYPRDPQGTAGDVINCRCSMVSVIPYDAQSNAQAIIDTEF